MTNRKLGYIVKDQKPLVLAAHETVQHACRCMRERRAGSVLVIDDQQRLSGILLPLFSTKRPRSWVSRVKTSKKSPF